MHTLSTANGINKFSTVEPVVSTRSPTKAVFQPGFNRPKQYKGEMRHMRHLYYSIPLSMVIPDELFFISFYPLINILIY